MYAILDLIKDQPINAANLKFPAFKWTAEYSDIRDGLCLFVVLHLREAPMRYSVGSLERHDRSGPANLNSAISGNSGYKAGPDPPLPISRNL